MEIQYLRNPAAFATVFCFFLARCFFLSLGPLFNSCIANVNPALPEIQKQSWKFNAEQHLQKLLHYRRPAASNCSFIKPETRKITLTILKNGSNSCGLISLQQEAMKMCFSHGSASLSAFLYWNTKKKKKITATEMKNNARMHPGA